MPHKKCEVLARAAIFINLRLLNGGVGAARYSSLAMFDLAANLNHHPVSFQSVVLKSPLLGRIYNS
jgi:hypothetical protein